MAVHADAAGSARRRAAGFFGVPIALHARHEEQHVVPVPESQRQRRDFLLADHRAEYRRLRVEQRRDAFDEHALADAADRKDHIELGALADLEPDRLCDRLKTGSGNLDEPFARAQPGDLVGAGVGRLAPRARRRLR